MKRTSVEALIEQINLVTLSWLRNGSDGRLRFVDPIDDEEISAHYGATHAAAAWILYGRKTGNPALAEKGIALLKSVLDRWESTIKLPAYHFDFNNFAMCIAYEAVKEEDADLSERIKKTVLTTPDSNNPTINWYPMRWYVNAMRYQWTTEQKYRDVCARCAEAIQNATYQDGFIDDRIPKGKSFNLQYDVATVAVMQFLRVRGEQMDISRELGALLNIQSPDGDINYLGRGTNQIFAWGLWIYLLSSAGREEAGTAVEYVQNRLSSMLNNRNLMLNDWPGEEKYFWWDYHYCSVYTAHLLLWLVLSLEDDGKAIVIPRVVAPSDSGVRVYRSEKCFVVTFEGRSEYLAERGPALVLVWTKKHGTMIKGCFAPWQGAFGNLYTLEDIALRNYCGLLSVRLNRDFSRNRYLHKIAPGFHTKETETVEPLFVPLAIEIQKDLLRITWKIPERKRFLINLPMHSDCKVRCEADGELLPVFHTAKIRNQYDWVNLRQSRLVSGRMVQLSIDI